MFKFGVAKLSSMLTLFVIAFILPTFVSPANLCSTSGLCCKHRDSECVAQRVYPNHTVDTSQLPCYCDHACIELEDCCPDYRQFCGVKDCHVSEWGPWSPCSADKCNTFGVEERHRVVLGHPVNGGMKCPHLLQSKQCQALPCENTNPEGSNNIIVNWRQQHLLQHYHNQQQEGKQKMFRRGDEHNNVRQSQHQHKKKQQQKQSNQRERMNKQDIKNNKDKEYKELPRKNKQHEEAFNEHYQHTQKHLNKKQKEYSRQVWKEDKTFLGNRFVGHTHQLQQNNENNNNRDETSQSSSRKDKVLSVKKRTSNKKRKSKNDEEFADYGLQNGSEGCMEMVVIRASTACHEHDKRLHLGTRICLECTPIHRHITKGHNEPLGNGTTVSAYRTKRVDETSSSCSAAALTEMPIRKFRINHTCHGKLTFLTKNLSLKCNCRKGLHYELV